MLGHPRRYGGRRNTDRGSAPTEPQPQYWI